MAEFAHRFLEEQAPETDGSSKEAHLRQAAKWSKDAKEQLESIELCICPQELQYLWEYFLELTAARGSTGWSALPIGYQEIQAWASLTGIVLFPWEVFALRRLDQVCLEVIHARSRRAKSGSEQ